MGEWLLNGNANDTSGNGLNATAANVTWASSNIGSAQALNGSFDGGYTSQVSQATDLGLNGVTQNYTFSLWMKPSVDVSGQSVLFNHVDGTRHVYSYLEYYAGAVRMVRVRGGLAADVCGYGMALNANQAHHMSGPTMGRT